MYTNNHSNQYDKVLQLAMGKFIPLSCRLEIVRKLSFLDDLIYASLWEMIGDDDGNRRSEL